MFVNKENWDDCKKYYQDTWVKFKEGGDNKIFYISEVNPKYILAKDINNEIIGVDLEEGYTIEYAIPKKTTFQLGEYALHLFRVPARQWKKGINKQNTNFSYLNPGSGWLNYTFDANVINGFVNKPTYYTIENAINEFKTSEHLKSAALDSRTSMTNKGMVYIDTVPVARADLEKEQVVVKKLFEPEITQLFQNFKIRTVK